MTSSPEEPNNRSDPVCEELSSPETTAASSTDAPTPTASKSTTSPPNPKEEPTKPTTWQPSAGTTTTSPSTATDSNSTPAHPLTGEDSSGPGQPAGNTPRPGCAPSPQPDDPGPDGPISASPSPDSFAFPAPLKSEEPVYPLCLTKPLPPPTRRAGLPWLTRTSSNHVSKFVIRRRLPVVRQPADKNLMQPCLEVRSQPKHPQEREKRPPPPATPGPSPAATSLNENPPGRMRPPPARGAGPNGIRL